MSNDQTFDTVTGLIDAGFKNDKPKTYIVEEMEDYVPPELPDVDFQGLSATLRRNRPFPKTVIASVEALKDVMTKQPNWAHGGSRGGRFPRAVDSHHLKGDAFDDNSYPPVPTPKKTIRDLLNEKRRKQGVELGVCVQRTARSVWSDADAFKMVMQYRATLHSMGNMKPLTVFQTSTETLRIDQADKLCKLGGLRDIKHLAELSGSHINHLKFLFSEKPATFDRLLIGTLFLHKGWGL